MSGNAGPGFGKDPLTPCHGDSLVDQSFQSLKSKEIRDSMSPTQDMKFHSLSLNHPNTTGWDVQTSSEVSPDGRARRTDTLATTDGVERINGGMAEFKGRNEQHSSASHQGDDKNFVKKASDSSNTHLQEKVVIGDENSGRTEMKMSSTTSSSTSKVVSSSSTVEYDGGEPAPNRYLTDGSSHHHAQHQHEQQLRQERLQQEQYQQQQQLEQNRRISEQQRHQHQTTEEYNRNRQETSRNVETQQTTEQTKRVIDVDKASPEYQKQVQYLMAQPGEIISNTVEYPKPNVKMITTVKRLPDGTIVKNKRYETEELHPEMETTSQRNTSTTNQTNTQRRNERRVQDENIYSRLKNTRDNTTSVEHSTSTRPQVDTVDNVERVHHIQDRNRQHLVEARPSDRYSDDAVNVETSFSTSSVKKSSQRFSTETTSESIEEHDERTPSSAPNTRGKPVTKDFSTHGFPSVKSNKPTQEYPSDRPHAPRPTSDFSTHGFPSVKSNKPTQEYPTDRPQAVRSTEVHYSTERNVVDSKKPSSDLTTYPSARPITTADGEVIIVSSEKQRTVKQHSNVERIIETEVVTDADYPSHDTRNRAPITQAPSSRRPEDFSTHGFPSVRDTSSPQREGSPRHSTPSREYPSSPRKPDFSTHGFPSTRDTVKQDGDVFTVSSETRHSSKQHSNVERIIETDVTADGDYPGTRYREPNSHTSSPRRPEDFSTHGFPSVGEPTSPQREGSPRQGTPLRDYPSSPRRSQPNEGFSPNEYPSVRSPHFSTHDTPKSGTKPTQMTYQTQPGTSTTTKKSTTTETTQKLLHKEKEVDAAHRAFAASLRSSSPVDNTRRDSYPDHQRHTPRSSVSSTKTFSRNTREGSHESAVPSETSRISTSTVTRQSPSKTVGKTVVSKQTVVKTRNVNGSNETIDLTPQRSTKSPSPGKTVTTTTRTTTIKNIPVEVPKPEKSRHSPAPSSHTNRTHPKNKSPIRDDNLEKYDEPITEQPSSSSDIESNDRNKFSSKPQNSSPQNLRYPKEPSVERRTVVRESTFEKTDNSKFLQNEPAKPSRIEPKEPSPRTSRRPNVSNKTETQDDHDYPKGAQISKEPTYKQPSPRKSTLSHETTLNDQKTLEVNETEIILVTDDQPEKPTQTARKPTQMPTNKFSAPQKPLTTKLTSTDNDLNQEHKKPIQTPTRKPSGPHKLSPKSNDDMIPDDDYPKGTQTAKKVAQPTSPTNKNNKTEINKPKPRNETTREDEIFQQTHHTKQTKHSKNINEEFITIESKKQTPNEFDDDESPDGAFISKDTTVPTPTSPTFRKKGLSRRETFEERCRQILGMENDGDTQGTFKKTTDNEAEIPDEPLEKEKLFTTPKETHETKFEVTIEDCDDDEPLYISNVKESLETRKNVKTLKTKITENEPYQPTKTTVTDKLLESERLPKSSPVKSNELPIKNRYPEKEDKPKIDEQVDVFITTESKNLESEHIQNSDIYKNTKTFDEPYGRQPKDREEKITTTKSSRPEVTEKTTIVWVTEPEPDTTSDTDTESAVSEIDTEQENFISEKVIKCNEKTILKKSTTTSSPGNKRVTPSGSNRNGPQPKSTPARISPTRSPSKKQPELVATSTRKPTVTKQKPMEPLNSQKNAETDKPFGLEKSPIKPVTKTVNDTNRKSSQTSATLEVKTTKKQTIPSKFDTQPSKIKSPKQPNKEPTPRITRKDSDLVEESSTTRRQPKKPSEETPTSTIKDRLRSSPNKQKFQPDDVDANSSPDTSPTRFTERRRSSNISVHTEIIIDHTGPKTPKASEPITKIHPQSPKDNKDGLVDRKILEKLNRKLPVTERKESAPVHRVTRKDKDTKMARSTSENVIKVTQQKPTKKPEMSSLTPNTVTKHDRRPNKCFTTKTINLITSDKLHDREEMENVIIDIQHAKSSREPSPDKIIPTPVPIDLDTGKPRYPDVVQEPEDEPRKKPVVKNIPIYEEEANDFVGVHISEINIEKTTKSTDYIDYNEDILDNPTVEAPKSLDYPSIDRPDDDCLLSVHEKVSKFTHTAEEVKKPKASSPFNREFDQAPKVPEDDDCLLTVDQKVDKFLKTAETITKQPITPVREFERTYNYDDLDEELRNDDCILSVSQKVHKFIDTAEKLAPSAPQKSPELVARMERHISRQSEPEEPEQINFDEPSIPFSENHTVEIELKRQKDILSRPSVWKKPKDQYEHEETKKENLVEHTTFEENSSTSKTIEVIDDDDDDELVPMTKSHTTSIELKRQKDILSRPTVFEVSKSPVPKRTDKIQPLKKTEDTTKKPTPQYEKPISNDKFNTTIERKPRKPSESKIDDHRVQANYHTSTVSTTKSRFETPSNERRPTTEPVKPEKHQPGKQLPKRKPSSEQEVIQDTETDEFEYQTTDTETEIKQTTRGRSTSKTNETIRIRSEVEKSPSQSRKTPSQRNVMKPATSPTKTPVSHSPTTPSTKSTKTTVTKITERTFKHTSPSKSSDTESVEPIPEQLTQTKYSPGKTGKSSVITESVAARRNIFERNAAPKSNKPTTPVHTSRRPSYMDHTKSSLEHTRRDSLEINKSNYSRKSSIEDDSQFERRPNTAVKFDVPQKSPREPSTSEDINIEEIFELELLEQLLETVTSYELRRRIRAQIRLVKKNILNVQSTDTKRSETKTSSVTSSSTQKSTTHSTKAHLEETDSKHFRKPTDYSYSPSRPSKPQHEETVTITRGKYSKKPRDHSHSPVRQTKVQHEESVTTREEKYTRDHSRSPNRPSKVHHERPEPVNEGVHTRKSRDRSLSPDSHGPTISSTLKEVRRGSSTSTNKQYTRTEETDYSLVTHSPRPERKQPQPHDRSHSPSHKATTKSAERSPSPKARDRSSSPEVKIEFKKTIKVQPRERSISPQAKTIDQHKGFYSSSKKTVSTSHTSKERKQSSEVYHSPERTNRPQPQERSHSPTYKPKPKPQQTNRDRSISPKQYKSAGQHEETYTAESTTVRTTQSPERKSTKSKPDNKSPIWADRKNVLKTPPSSTTRKAPTSPTMRTSATKTVKSSSQQRQHKTAEEDSITSSYGIGPTDENGLPLFGIRALKKKKQTQPCETTEEVTGYVVEEKYYSDSKTKPIVQRKEYIYSTNADELEQIKKKVESKKLTNEDEVVRKYQKIDKEFAQNEPRAIMSSEEFSIPPTTYVRRGSVKEMSEKFIRKESSQSITEKSSSYPKAGLILRTSSRLGSTDAADCFDLDTENYTKTRSDIRHTDHADDTSGGAYEIEMQRSSRMVTESESECESVNIQRETSKRSSTSTRSFLNSAGEVVTDVDDVLERMRNADNVVEEGDTAEDQEARALLNKFLGASVIMRGVEGVLPTKQTKTTTATSYAHRGDGDNLRKQEVKTTRVTKTIKSGSSSTPVTRTTCDIEEIWDEEILKELLEQATTYEERRKIRARLRVLMAEREDANYCS